MSRCGNSVIRQILIFWTRHALYHAVFNLAFRKLERSISMIAQQSILLIFSLQLIREDRG
jgi:hypothetical protein